MTDISVQDLTHQEKDDLIRLTKLALQLACARLALYEGMNSPTSQPEEWVGRAFLITKTKGWNNDTGI